MISDGFDWLDEAHNRVVLMCVPDNHKKIYSILANELRMSFINWQALLLVRPEEDIQTRLAQS